MLWIVVSRPQIHHAEAVGWLPDVTERRWGGGGQIDKGERLHGVAIGIVIHLGDEGAAIQHMTHQPRPVVAVGVVLPARVVVAKQPSYRMEMQLTCI
ncbi:MAG TPA: hypothetical protein PLD47_15110 [Aggregatilineales bacterium]|nr:hypothetical protein [Aggregatilineales bacterium]